MFKRFLGLTAQLRRRWLYGFMAAVMAVSIIALSPMPSQAQRVPRWLNILLQGVQYVQLANMSDRQEVELGGRINQQLTSRQFRVYNNREVNEYINDLGQRLAEVSDRPNIPYTFQVVAMDQINAFATMGGYVYLTTGLLRAAENEAEVVGVLGHEIGHVVARHAVQQMRDRALAAGVATAAGVDNNAAIAIGVELAVNRPNSRRDEYEADDLGLRNMVDAGYAPRGFVDFMEKLRGRSGTPTFLNTHPAPDDRIERLNQSIDPATADVGAGLDPAAYRARIRPLV
ncbi:MAG: M48 family metalloprotease [Kaiparowitsia implicata GSE-PSE-MK54-09C]|jgi:predicted Zn-dependent protease|nr:M48 family metalloprotease [Kaiparowitsia implicata GSE-PSE-MK54-09C]